MNPQTISIHGQTMTFAEASIKYGVPHWTIRNRIHSGLDPELAVSLPVGSGVRLEDKGTERDISTRHDEIMRLKQGGKTYDEVASIMGIEVGRIHGYLRSYYPAPLRCVDCGATECVLVNHHVSYVPDVVVSVCQRCHGFRHSADKSQRRRDCARVYTIGTESHTIREWSEKTGLSIKKIRSRVERGVVGADLISTHQLGSRFLNVRGERGTCAYFSKKYGVPRGVLSARLQAGVPEEIAATTPVGEKLDYARPKQQVKITERNTLYTIHGETKTLSAWVAQSGITRSTLTYRIRNRWPEELWLAPSGTKAPADKTRSLVTINGETLSRTKMAKKYGISAFLLRSRVAMGWKDGDLLLPPCSKSAQYRMITINGETHTLADWASKSGMSSESLSLRLDRMSPKLAIACPVGSSGVSLESRGTEIATKHDQIMEMKELGKTYADIAQDLGISIGGILHHIRTTNPDTDRCELCGKGGVIVNHHTSYVPEVIVRLCQSCHAHEHKQSTADASRRVARKVTVDGVEYTLSELSKKSGVALNTIRYRVLSGWNPQDIMAGPHSIHKHERVLNVDGETGSIAYFSKKYGVGEDTISARLGRGIPDKDAVTLAPYTKPD
jgi:DNA-binding CsgD family transcriptional regulator